MRVGCLGLGSDPRRGWQAHVALLRASVSPKDTLANPQVMGQRLRAFFGEGHGPQATLFGGHRAAGEDSRVRTAHQAVPTLLLPSRLSPPAARWPVGPSVHLHPSLSGPSRQTHGSVPPPRQPALPLALIEPKSVPPYTRDERFLARLAWLRG